MVIIDANAAVGIVRGTEEGKALKALILDNEEILAPDHFLCEVANVFWKYVHAGLMSREEASSYFKAAESLITRFVRQNVLMPEVLHTAIRLDHPVYDIVYLVLARRMDATLVTLDRKLIGLCEQEDIDHIDFVTLPPLED